MYTYYTYIYIYVYKHIHIIFKNLGGESAAEEEEGVVGHARGIADKNIG